MSVGHLYRYLLWEKNVYLHFLASPVFSRIVCNFFFAVFLVSLYSCMNFNIVVISNLSVYDLQISSVTQ